MIQSLFVAMAVAWLGAAETALDRELATVPVGAWAVYEVTPVERVELPCCFDWSPEGSVHMQPSACRLSGHNARTSPAREDPRSTRGDALRIYVRRAERGFDRVAALASSCPIDTEGAPVTRLERPTGAASVAFLAAGLAVNAIKRLSHEVLAAIAHHRDAAATQVLLQLAKAGAPTERDAYFWLALRRGDEGFDAVRQALERSPSK
ncbi:MAG: hypothetical protein AAFV29_25335, partial [Myxococcota bacterium]